MTPTFESICDRIAAEFLTFTSDATVLFQRGKLKLAEHQDKRRVVFVRPGGKVTPATRAGSVDMSDGTRSRMVKRLEEQVFAHIYAETESAAEQLFADVITCCQAVLGTGFQPGDYQVLTEDAQASHHKYTETIRLEMRWHKPVTDQPEPLTQIESEAHQCSFGEGDFNPADFSAADFLTAGGEAA